MNLGRCAAITSGVREEFEDVKKRSGLRDDIHFDHPSWDEESDETSINHCSFYCEITSTTRTNTQSGVHDEIEIMK